ncbi:MAG TPA: DHA2 family efflux MFS transporter permease subunit [Polyangiales bacterium]|nr:DHA2 family efflux MFS transporter permease subunit [Polyangiales bacterium]
MSTHVDTGEAWTGGKNPWAIAWVVTLATFMEMLDVSIANVALPHIAGSLSATQEQSSWILTTYLLANAIMLPISGWLATRIGRKRYYMISVTLFTLSSLACGLAPSLGWLVFFRALQGLGGGGLAPSEQAILADTFPAEKRSMAMALYGMSVIFAPAIGPSVGGYFTDHYSWRWIFLINVPVGVVSLVLTQRWVSDPPRLQALRNTINKIDVVGLMLIVLGLGGMQLVLSRGQEQDWFHSSEIRITVTIAVVALVTFILWEWRQRHPIVDLSLFRSSHFALANLMMLFASAALYGTTLLFPQYVQTVMHYTAHQAGLVLTPGGFLLVALMPVAGKLATRIDSRWLVAFGFLAITTSLFHMAGHLYPGLDMPAAIRLRCYQIIGSAFVLVPLSTLAYDGVAPEKRNAASGIINLSRNLGGEIGISIVTTLVARRSQLHQAQLVEHVTESNPELREVLHVLVSAVERAGSSSYEAARRAYVMIYRGLGVEALTLSYIDALRMLGVATACMIPIVVFLNRPRSAPSIAETHR